MSEQVQLADTGVGADGNAPGVRGDHREVSGAEAGAYELAFGREPHVREVDHDVAGTVFVIGADLLGAARHPTPLAPSP